MSVQQEQESKVYYSRAFKQKVVSEIESGKLNRNQAMELYGIKGGSTINYWIKKMGKNHLLNKVVRIELKDEPSKLRELKEHNRALEKALADAHLRLVAYECYLEIAEEELGKDIKKKPVLERLSKLKQEAKIREKRLK